MVRIERRLETVAFQTARLVRPSIRHGLCTLRRLSEREVDYWPTINNGAIEDVYER